MSGDDAGLYDAVAWRARRDPRELADDAPWAADSLDERLRDLLHRDSIRAARARAQQARAGRRGEADRESLRILLDPFLDLAGADATLDLARARREGEPEAGFRAEILRHADPLERRRVQRAWESEEDRLERRRRARRDVLDAAAREVGSPSCFELCALTLPIAPARTAAAVARSAIEPLDGRVAAGAAQRRSRFRPRLPESSDPSDAILLGALADHQDALDSRAVLRRVRALARALDLDPDNRGPALIDGAARRAGARVFEWLEPRPAFSPGRGEGPAGLADGLEALGRAARARAIRAALAVLLEERLRTRSGHLWFLDPRSPRFLREVWDAEGRETAESVADALDLGTMDALLLHDGYRV